MDSMKIFSSLVQEMLDENKILINWFNQRTFILEKMEILICMKTTAKMQCLDFRIKSKVGV